MNYTTTYEAESSTAVKIHCMVFLVMTYNNLQGVTSQKPIICTQSFSQYCDLSYITGLS
jgi:hypothetical protein